MLYLSSAAASATTKTAFQNGVQQRTFIKGALMSLATTAYSAVAPSIELANKMERNEVHSVKSANEIELERMDQKKKLLGILPKSFERPTKLYPNHIPLYNYEKLMLFFGSSIGAFLHPERNEFIVALGESTATTGFLTRLRNDMLDDPVGRQILKDRPYITSDYLNLEKLSKYPEGSFGKCYYDWLIREHCSPDERVDVKFIDDEELAFVFQRYRQCHDFYHALVGIPVFREGEIALKFFEYLNIGVPFAGLGALFAPWNVKKAAERERLFKVYYPWALRNAYHCKKNLINVYWEKIMEKNVNDIRRELNIELPPDMRTLRKQYKKTHKVKPLGV
jgi:ubiquinone biosynthesis protein COQ4